MNIKDAIYAEALLRKEASEETGRDKKAGFPPLDVYRRIVAAAEDEARAADKMAEEMTRQGDHGPAEEKLNSLLADELPSEFARERAEEAARMAQEAVAKKIEEEKNQYGPGLAPGKTPGIVTSADIDKPLGAVSKYAPGTTGAAPKASVQTGKGVVPIDASGKAVATKENPFAPWDVPRATKENPFAPWDAGSSGKDSGKSPAQKAVEDAKRSTNEAVEREKSGAAPESDEPFPMEAERARQQAAAAEANKGGDWRTATSGGYPEGDANAFWNGGTSATENNPIFNQFAGGSAQPALAQAEPTWKQRERPSENPADFNSEAPQTAQAEPTWKQRERPAENPDDFNSEAPKGPATEEEWAAQQFQHQHGGEFDPKSRVDKQKMQAILAQEDNPFRKEAPKGPQTEEEWAAQQFQHQHGGEFDDKSRVDRQKMQAILAQEDNPFRKSSPAGGKPAAPSANPYGPGLAPGKTEGVVTANDPGKPLGDLSKFAPGAAQTASAPKTVPKPAPKKPSSGGGNPAVSKVAPGLVPQGGKPSAPAKPAGTATAPTASTSTENQSSTTGGAAQSSPVPRARVVKPNPTIPGAWIGRDGHYKFPSVAPPPPKARIVNPAQAQTAPKKAIPVHRDPGTIREAQSRAAEYDAAKGFMSDAEKWGVKKPNPRAQAAMNAGRAAYNAAGSGPRFNAGHG